jgi:hypothetical protein
LSFIVLTDPEGTESFSTVRRAYRIQFLEEELAQLGFDRRGDSLYL